MLNRVLLLLAAMMVVLFAFSATAQNRTSLHIAAEENDTALAERMLRSTRVDVRDDEGLTPLYLTARHGSYDVALLLLEAGADPNLRQGFWGVSPFYVAQYNGFGRLVALLREYGGRD